MTYQEQFFRLMIWFMYGGIGFLALCAIGLIFFGIVEKIDDFKIAREISKIESEVLKCQQEKREK